MTANIVALDTAETAHVAARGRMFSAIEGARARYSNHLRWRRRVRKLIDDGRIGDPLLRQLLEMVLESGLYPTEICARAGVCETAIMNIVRGRNPTIGTVAALLGACGRRLAIVPEGEK